MGNTSIEFFIDLEDVAATISARASQTFFDELQKAMRANSNTELTVVVEKGPLARANSKSPEALAIGGMALVLTGTAAYLKDAKKVVDVLNAAWKLIKKVVPRNTSVKISVGTKKIEISTSDKDDALALLRASAEVTAFLQTTNPKAIGKRHRVLTIAPRKP